MIDQHTPTHFCGSFVLYTVLLMWFPSMTAALTALGLGIVWELMDQFNKQMMLRKIPWLDPNGGSCVDIGVDAGGIAFGIFVIKNLLEVATK